MKPANSEPLGQQVVKNLSNIFFAFFVLAVLIFTVIAVTYQPADPWLEPAKDISKVFSSVENATFQVDDSILRTGEDIGPAIGAPAISEAIVEDVKRNINAENSAALSCDPKHGLINCSDPGVLAAIVLHNLKRFPNLNFYEYQIPVKGLGENECDVAWKFRAKQEKSWRMYRDYRRFSLNLEESCNYIVVHAGGWHSGKNARRFGHGKGPFGRRTPRGKPENLAIPKNLTVTEEVEVIEDSVPLSPSESAFRKSKYLYYSRGGDHCKGMNHFLWSFLCALGEAQYLNRTFVIDLDFCLSSSNNPGHPDEDGKDFRFYFDYVHLKEATFLIEKQQFLDDWRQWNQKHRRDQLSVTEVNDFKITPMQLQNDRRTIIHRKFDAQEPDNYWYRVCEGETEKVVQRPWDLLWKSKRIMDIVNAICGKMEWDFDAVHVVRGEKAANKELWPNLDRDTSAENILEKLKEKLEPERYVYIATNEMDPGYFDTLKENEKIHTLDYFKDLWAENSLWYNETKWLTKGRSVEFDGYMRAEVDTEVLYRAKTKIETFNDLTKDCKDGVNTC